MNKITLGDCIDLMKQLDADSIELVFADPPFNIGYKYDSYHDSRDPGEYLHWCEGWMREIYRVLTETGTYWLSIGDEYVSEMDVLAKRLGFHKRSHVVWYYTFGQNMKKQFNRSHTHLLYYTCHQKRFTFNTSEIRVSSARQLVYNDKRADPNGRLPDNTWILRPQDVPNGFSEDSDTWHAPRVAGTFHERQEGANNQMPEAVLGRIVRACSNRGNVVLDPFCGSGTTAAVAKKLGRKWLSFDVSESCVEMARNRLAKVRVGDAILGEKPFVGGG
jgi:site-specific DNA-methyltransferase (adenine-specific)